MDQRWLQSMLQTMRQIGNDTQTCEVKEAAGGLPKSIAETLSAFSNGSGGYLILGISEKQGFIPVAGFDARRMQNALAEACDRLTPIVRPEIAIFPYGGTNILCARIHEMHPRDKPCYITSRRLYDGAYIRTGDGDRQLSPYEIERMLEARRQPTYDDEVVAEATMADLDEELCRDFIRRQKSLHTRVLAAKSDEDVLLALHVIRRDGDALRPTLGGLMAMGAFPQQFFPRLNITFTAFPGTTKAGATDGGPRFLDAQTIVGPIPYLIADALAAVRKNMRTAGVIEGAFRRDVPDYPPVAVREAIANALMHRDYSPEGRGSQVQVNLYTDRLEVMNPGGLYGDVTVESLGVDSTASSRNQFLSNILETTPYPGGGFVVENRGTGYQAMQEELRRAAMPPPKPRNTTATFTLTFEKRADQTIPGHTASGGKATVEETILAYLQNTESASAQDLARAAGASRSAVAKQLRRLTANGTVEALEPPRSPKQRYRLKGKR